MDGDIHELIDKKYRDVKSEVVVLAHVLRKNAGTELGKSCFSTPPHRLLWDIAQTHRSVMPKEAVVELVERRVRAGKIDAYLAAVDRVYKIAVSGTTTKTLRTLTAKLKRLMASREILLKSDDVVSRVLDGKLDEARKLGRQIAIAGSRPATQYAGDYLQDFEQRKELMRDKVRNPERIGVPTGIRKFDLATGGLLRGEFGIILGQTNLGKSMALENFAINAWFGELNHVGANHNVLYVSVEMTKHELQFRADSRLASIPHRHFRLAKGWKKKDVRRWTSRIGDLRRRIDTALHFECVPRHCTVADIETVAERVQDERQCELDLIVIDYLNVLGAGSTKGESSRQWHFQADIAWDVRSLSLEFNAGKGIAVWTASQVTDKAEGKEVLSFTDTKYARASAEVAPVVLGLVQTQKDRLRRQMQLQVIKFRGTRRVQPIIMRPNFDLCLLDEETRAIRSLDDV